MSHEQALDDFEVPRTTPQAERQRLLSKGQLLAEHCLDDGHADCVLGFVEHCLGKSPAQLDVVMDLRGDLRREYARLRAHAAAEDARRLALLDELLQDMTSRLMHALRS
jgi:hypothetical protein